MAHDFKVGDVIHLNEIDRAFLRGQVHDKGEKYHLGPYVITKIDTLTVLARPLDGSPCTRSRKEENPGDYRFTTQGIRKDEFLTAARKVLKDAKL